jgi:hypothetical protein
MPMNFIFCEHLKKYKNRMTTAKARSIPYSQLSHSISSRRSDYSCMQYTYKFALANARNATFSPTDCPADSPPM